MSSMTDTTEPRQAAPAEDSHILVVDDNAAGRYTKAHALRRAGYEVTEIGTGGEALVHIGHRRPAVVLLDVKLPDLDGREVCRRLKAADPGVMVLQTSAALIESSDRASALASGADSYLIEPIEPPELVATVEALLRLHRAERELRLANETLERKVAARTREIAEVNARLVQEIEQRSSAEQALMHAQKLEAIGQLTGGIAHDFNNLLTVILGNLEFLDRGLAASVPLPRERQQRLLGGAIRAARDCETLTSQLLAFARRNPARREVVDVNRAIAEFAPLMRRAAGEQVTVEFALAPRLWPSHLDVRQLEAAILNLAVNARDAMPEGGTIRIETGNVTVAPGLRDPLVPADLAPGDYVRVIVSDTGSGMDADVAAHAFEPFFTTKEVGKGTGLGLSQVYGFSRQAGGSVALQSWIGKGTQIAMLLPRSTEQVHPVAAGTAAGAEMAGGGETILVVDDNLLVRAFVADALAELGYRVLEAGDGPEALTVLEASPVVDLLLTDIVMPNRLSGVELARLAQERRPGIKVIITSGFSQADLATAHGATPLDYLAKPYRIPELARRLREVLGGRSGGGGLGRAARH